MKYFIGLLLSLWLLALTTDASARTCVIVGASNQDQASWFNTEGYHQMYNALDSLSYAPGMNCRWYSYVLKGESMVDQINAAYADTADIDVLVVGSSNDIFTDTGTEVAMRVASTWRTVRHTPYIVVIRYPDATLVTRESVRIKQSHMQVAFPEYNAIVDAWPVILIDYPIYETYDNLHATNKTNYAVGMEIYLQLIAHGF